MNAETAYNPSEMLEQFSIAVDIAHYTRVED